MKPSNVLVCTIDGRPVTKVIDFGVAKAVEKNLTPEYISTQHGVLIGTPAYMSPEQVDEGAMGIDTRVDVYALGVILFQLLTGKLPFNWSRTAASGLSELLRGHPQSGASPIVDRDRARDRRMGTDGAESTDRSAVAATGPRWRPRLDHPQGVGQRPRPALRLAPPAG